MKRKKTKAVLKNKGNIDIFLEQNSQNQFVFENLNPLIQLFIELIHNKFLNFM